MLGPSGRVFPRDSGLTKLQCEIRETFNGILDLTKIQCGTLN